MFRYAFPAEPSAVADAPKAAVIALHPALAADLSAAVAPVTVAPAAPAAAPLDGARS
ncbi:hypothetical protein [Streptomyces sp. NPDC058657]|uniref:hypothetical protein n=1 Tax=unclassified Streptomyces TaxID=2593676 RepID=UPI00366A4F49